MAVDRGDVFFSSSRSCFDVDSVMATFTFSKGFPPFLQRWGIALQGGSAPRQTELVVLLLQAAT